MGDPVADRPAGDEPGTPRWVKISTAVALVLVVVIAIVMLTTGGHGPGRHTLAMAASTSPPLV